MDAKNVTDQQKPIIEKPVLYFPSDLKTGPTSKYGNQFVSFYINEIIDSNTQGNTETSNKVKSTRGQILRDRSRFGIAQGGGVQNAENLSPRTTVASIYLPIPNKITTNYGVNYSDMDFGTEAFALAGTAAAGLLDVVKKSMVGSPVQKLLTAVTESNTITQAATLGLKGVGAVKGYAFNPHKELLFSGVKLRTFEFSWKMIARSAPESEMILKIQKEFRKAMHPKLEFQSALYRYPADFDIEFWKMEGNDAVINKFLTFISPCVLTDCVVNYSGAGEYVSFEKTAAPVEIDFTLKFQETVVLTKDLLELVKE